MKTVVIGASAILVAFTIFAGLYFAVEFGLANIHPLLGGLVVIVIVAVPFITLILFMEWYTSWEKSRF